MLKPNCLDTSVRLSFKAMHWPSLIHPDDRESVPCRRAVLSTCMQRLISDVTCPRGLYFTAYQHCMLYDLRAPFPHLSHDGSGGKANQESSNHIPQIVPTHERPRQCSHDCPSEDCYSLQLTNWGTAQGQSDKADPA